MRKQSEVDSVIRDEQMKQISELQDFIKAHDVNLTLTAFRKAYASRDVRYGLIFHSDQGSEYTAFAFRK